MSTKTYICTKFLDLTTEVMVNGKIKQIRLKGGIVSPRRINGTFTTNDTELQEAIEASPGFGKRYKLFKDWGESKQASDEPKKVITPVITGPHNATEEITITGPTPETSPDAVKEEIPEKVDESKEAVEKIKNTDPINDDLADAPSPSDSKFAPERKDPIINEAATSGQKARAFLVSYFDDVTVSKLRNNAMIRKLAKERNVEFPNWPEE